jgi:large subunit ribosomal protein L25
MAHETPKIQAEPRERVGTRYARRLRKAGRLPAVIYGHGVEPLAVHVDETEVVDHLRHGLHVMEVTVNGGKKQTCLVKELQYGYLGDDIVHLDFARVNLQEEVTVNVHLDFVGEPEESHHAGAIIRHDLTELSVRCKVSAIPEEIKVDLATMKGQQLHAGEVSLPPGVVLAEDEERIVASIGFVKKTVTAAEEAEVEAVEGEPEVITELREGEEAEVEAGGAEEAKSEQESS